MIKAQRTLLPGKPGTKNAMNKYGDKLICVRYRIDPSTLKKFKTVELIEEEIQRKKDSQRIPSNKKMDIRINVKETQLRKFVKATGARWNYEKQT